MCSHKALIMLHLISLFLHPFFFIALLAQSDNSTYPNCASHNCGDVTISYPFWKMDTEPTAQFCGYEGFGINCSIIGDRSSPKLTFGGDSYDIQWINYEYRSVLVVDTDVSSGVRPSNNCSRVQHGINLQTLPLNFSTLDVNLSFRFDCDECPSFATEIPCFARNERKSCVHVMNISTDEMDWDEYSCRNEVVTTVIREHINRFPNLSSDFGELLRRGFELQWWRMDDCARCEDSGGRCGRRNTTGSVCFCSDGTIGDGDCKGIQGKGLSWGIKLGIGLGSALVSLVIIFILYSTLKSPLINCVASLKHKTEDDKYVEAFVKQYGPLSTERYEYNDIKKMTNSFKIKLGQGGFGQVYKGKLSDGRLVAVKVLNSSKANAQEFINEVASIGRTSHVNIVTLFGFCFENKKRALVYEYMPNGSLEKFLHSHVAVETNEQIGVKKLYDIALGIAGGLDYLHRGCNNRILHLDIKPHNILLDEDFCPKIADFGLAKLYSRKESVVPMLEARGTIGYISPEVYNKNFGGVSHKSDVYSYGMLLLEMVGVRKNLDKRVDSTQTSDIYFPDWIYSRLRSDDFLSRSVTTPQENDYTRKMTIVGLWCIQPAPNQRPSINKVIEMLEGSTEALEVPPKPFFSSPSPSSSSNTEYSISESMTA